MISAAATTSAFAEEPSCLSGQNPRFNRAGPQNPGAAPSDVGFAKIMEIARTEYKNKAQDAIYSQLGKVKPASNPAFKDQFGRPVNPITLMPGYAIGAQQVFGLLGSEAASRAIIDAVLDDYAKRRILGMIVSRYQLADDLITQYRMRAARGPVTPDLRAQYVERIGHLLNNNDKYLKDYFALDTINPNVKDGTVRARAELDVVDANLKDERLQKAAADAYKLIQNTDSYYKYLTLDELECRMKALSADMAEAEGIAKARADAGEHQRSRQRIIDQTRIHDEERARNPSPRPQSTDVIPGGTIVSPSTTPTTGGQGLDIGGVGATVGGNVLQYEAIAPKYTPLQTQPQNVGPPLRRQP